MQAPPTAAPGPLVPRAHEQPKRAAELATRRERRAAGRYERKRDRLARLAHGARLERHRKRVDRYLTKHRARMAERRGPEPECPPAFRLDHWRYADANWYDSTGQTARALLALIPPVWAGCIRAAALGLVDGVATRGWESERARNIITLGVVICLNASATRRKGRRSYLLRGFTQGAFGKLCQGGRAEPLHRNTISGEHRMGAADHSGQLGYLDALARYGLFYSLRLPPHEAEPWEVWTVERKRRDGSTEQLQVTSSQFWLVNPNPFDTHLAADVRAALVELAQLGVASAAIRRRPRARRPGEALPAPTEPAPAPD